MSLARMSQHKNRNRRCHLVDELKNIPQNKNTKQTNENLKDWKENQKKNNKKTNQINKPKGCPVIFCWPMIQGRTKKILGCKSGLGVL